MLKASTLFTDMEKRIKKIKTKYMGRQVRNERTDPVNYTFDRLNTAAYRLLVHAELEGYIEAKASEILALIKNDVVTKGYATAYLKNILAIACHLDEVVAIEKPYDEQDFIRSVLALIAKAEKKVKDNNGIKKNSFKMLALFSGYDVNAIDAMLLSNLNTYGVGRGSVAHNGVGHVSNFLSPSSEVTEVETIVRLLRMHYYGF